MKILKGLSTGAILGTIGYGIATVANYLNVYSDCHQYADCNDLSCEIENGNLLMVNGTLVNLRTLCEQEEMANINMGFDTPTSFWINWANVGTTLGLFTLGMLIYHLSKKPQTEQNSQPTEPLMNVSVASINGSSDSSTYGSTAENGLFAAQSDSQSIRSDNDEVKEAALII